MSAGREHAGEPRGIRLLDSLEGIDARHLQGFFAGWAAPPTPEQHLAILAGSTHVVLAWDAAADRVAGFANALSDGRLAAFIPLLEVLPAYQGRGIGSAIMRRLLARLEGHYAVDVVCDDSVAPFYERLGLAPGRAMMRRDYAWARSGR